LGVGQKLSPFESIRISAGFRSFDDKLTTVSFCSLLISLCLENLRFRLVVSPSADLDKFARSLRIKEYFSAKERDCPVDGSSDSEDDNEIPLPRFKKKKNHGFQNPAKLQL
jgi:hypothetical protein